MTDNDKELLAMQEAFVLAVTEEVCRIMQEKGLSKADMASFLGSSNAHVTQLLSGARNMTLYTLAEICLFLGEEPHLELKRRLTEDNTSCDICGITLGQIKSVGTYECSRSPCGWGGRASESRIDQPGERDKETLAQIILVSPRTGKPLSISGEPRPQPDNSLLFTVSGSGERWGVVVGITELYPAADYKEEGGENE